MRHGRSWLVLFGVLSAAPTARGQLLSTYFPEGVPGYGAGEGVTVQSRVRPEFDPLGIQAGTVVIRPLLTESFGYNDNVLGSPEHAGAWTIGTTPSVLATTDSSAGSLAMYLSADNIRYLDEASQNQTNGAAFLGGTVNVGRDKLTLGAGYLAQHEPRTALDALPSDQPVAFQVANARGSYETVLGRFTLTPSIDLSQWTFQNTTIMGVPTSEAARDRTTALGALTLRYDWMQARDLLLVTRVLDTQYLHPAAGSPTNDSVTWQLLAGASYDADAVWRYHLLAGVEYRQSTSAGIASQTIGMAEGEAIWSPSGMTTVRANLARGIEDAAQTGLSNYTYTALTLTVDHELFRNVLLNGSAAAREAVYNQTGGQQTGLAAGAGATWLINRNLRLSLTYDFTDIRNNHLPPGTVAGNFTRDLTLLTLRLGW